MKCERGRSGQSTERRISRVVAASRPSLPPSLPPSPVEGPLGTKPPAQPGPVVKRNDSICALFKFDVFIMHYTIRLIWQFPLYLIKYLCRPEDGSSNQKGADLQCRWELWPVCSEEAISQSKLGKTAGKYDLTTWNLYRQHEKMLFCKSCTRVRAYSSAWHG